MSAPLVVVDADVLGRSRTGDETYVANLLRELPSLAHSAGIRIGAVTRHPALVPEGIEPLSLATPLQPLRMGWTLSRLLDRVGAGLVHTQYAIPLRCPCPAVVTVHDLSFERDSSVMKLHDRLMFKWAVPRAARAAKKVLTVSERSKHDLVEMYRLSPDKIVVTPNGVDLAFTPGPGGSQDYVLSVGAIQKRKNQIAALRAAQAVGLPLVVVGPEKDEAVARELRAQGATLRGYVSQEELIALYRGATCLVQASGYEGFGLPVLEAMACGTPVVIVPEAALLEVAGNAAVVVDDESLADGIQRAIADLDRLVAAGVSRASLFSWRVLAEQTIAAYEEVLGR